MQINELHITLLPALMLAFGPSSMEALTGNLVVSNVQVQQRPSTTLVDVFYDLQTVGDLPVTVWLFLSTDGGQSYPKPCMWVNGDVGAGVEPGLSRHIVWDVGEEHPELAGDNFSVRVVADDSDHIDGFHYCQPGTFTMGSPESELGRTSAETQHEVTLTQGFLMARHDVTEESWHQVMGGIPTAPDLPIVISWDMAVQFCNALSTLEGLTPAYTIHDTDGNVTWNRSTNGYRLPTEAEWEYACRAGSQTAFSSGTIMYAHACSPVDQNLDLVGWYCGNSEHPQPVGQKQPNDWDLYDMHGNVHNWVWNGYRADYENLSAVDPVHDVAPGDYRTIRGGSSGSIPRHCRSASRDSEAPGVSSTVIGFRVARTIFPPQIGSGTIEIDVTPEGLDAPWQITGPVYAEGIGSTTLHGKPAGFYMVIWGDIPGYETPPNQTITLIEHSAQLITGHYASAPQVPYPLAVTDIQSNTAILNWTMIDMTDVMASSDHYVVRYDGSHFFLSEDHGLTYTRSFPCELDVQYVFVFEDGSILFATHTACYYSHDWNSYSESYVWDLNGNPYAPQEFDNFSGLTVPPNRDIRQDKEILIWGNYSVRQGIIGNHIYLWYTTDRGLNVKACYRFNIPGTLGACHVHSVDCSPEGKWYVLTGDAPNRCHVMRAEYDDLEDAWTFTTVGSTGGYHYKWFQMIWEGDFVYYTWDTSNGGVMRFIYPDDLGDHSKHEMVLQTENDCLMLLHYKPTGEMIATITRWGGSADSRNYYYSRDGASWHYIIGDVPPGYGGNAVYLYNGVINGLGIAATKMYTSGESVYTLPTVTLDKAIREQGFPDAFPYQTEPFHGHNYDLEYRAIGEEVIHIDGVAGNDLPFLLDDLESSTEYEFRIRSVGIEGFPSAWSNWVGFYTRF